MSGLPELQDAVRRIPGIAKATIRWPDPLGPASLRVEFDGDADQHDVGEAVIRTLVDVGDVDLSTMLVEHEEQTSGASRPAFTTLVLDRVGQSLTVEVGLSLAGREISATAHTEEDDELVTVAAATLNALSQLDGAPAYAVSDVGLTRAGDSQVVHVLVDVVEAETSPLLGTALVARDTREATVRAALDAVNRHFENARRRTPDLAEA